MLTIYALRELKEWMGAPTVEEFMLHLEKNYFGQYDVHLAELIAKE